MNFNEREAYNSASHHTESPTRVERQPLLYVDVNLGPGKSERIVVYEGDTA